jgi:hypothetical protein
MKTSSSRIFLFPTFHASVFVDDHANVPIPNMRKGFRHDTTIAILTCLLTKGLAFTSIQKPRTVPVSSGSPRTCLNLVPVVEFRDDITFFSKMDSYRCCIDSEGKFQATDGEMYQLGFAEEKDLPGTNLGRVVYTLR